jgi:amino acid transporter
LARGAVLFFLIGGLAAINILGVKAGARLNNFLAAAKVLPLVIFVVAGLLLLRGTPAVSAAAASTAGPGPKEWLSALLLIVFTLSGFETALFPMGEARDTRHDAPFALFYSFLICTALYALIQVVVLRALGTAFAGDRPLAEAARIFLGRGGAAFMQVGAALRLRQPHFADAQRAATHLRARRTRRLPFGIRSGQSQVPHSLFFHRNLCSADLRPCAWQHVSE